MKLEEFFHCKTDKAFKSRLLLVNHAPRYNIHPKVRFWKDDRINKSYLRFVYIHDALKLLLLRLFLNIILFQTFYKDI